MDEELELTTEEKWIVLKSLQALHSLKYIPELVIVEQKKNDLLKTLIEEVVKIREALYG